MKRYLLQKTQLSKNNKYNYCPYCVDEYTRQNGKEKSNYMEILSPITYQRIMEVDKDKNGNETKYVDEFWECSRCKKKLTSEDFRMRYCASSVGEKDDGATTRQFV